MEPVVWSAVGAGVAGLLVVDLVVFSRQGHAVSLREAAVWSAIWLAVGLGFALVVWWLEDSAHAGGYLAGYLIERSLSVDNVFVFALVLSSFALPVSARSRALFWGVLMALVLRGIFIVTGAAILDTFHWAEYAFGAFLVVTAYRMFRQRSRPPRTEEPRMVRLTRRLAPSAPFVAVLMAIGVADVVFAVDSIPAIFAVTRDPFLVFTANAFAVLGMPALYFLLVGVLDRFAYLKLGLSAILALVGVKMLVADLYEVPVWASLATIAAILGVCILASMRKAAMTRRRGVMEPEHEPHAASVG